MGAAQSDPNINEEFQSRYRSLELFIVNKTKEATLQLKDEYFSSGSWFEHFPQATMEPGKEYKAFVANRKGAGTGVTGGLQFSINRETKYLLLGFTNPIMGCYKTYVNILLDDSCTAKKGYDNAQDDKHKVVTAEGYELEATLSQAKEGGDKMIIFTISDSEN